MQNPYEAVTGKGGDRPNPRDWDLEPDVYKLFHPLKQGMCVVCWDKRNGSIYM